MIAHHVWSLKLPEDKFKNNDNFSCFVNKLAKTNSSIIFQRKKNLIPPLPLFSQQSIQTD